MPCIVLDIFNKIFLCVCQVVDPGDILENKTTEILLDFAGGETDK